MAVNVDCSRPHVARRTFPYADGMTLDRGQVFKPIGARNDEKLIRLGYIVPLANPKATTYPCRLCGKEFSELSMLQNHGITWHPPDPATGEPRPTERLDEHDKAEILESVQQRENQMSPLYLDKTLANIDPAEASRQATGRKYV